MSRHSTAVGENTAARRRRARPATQYILQTAVALAARGRAIAYTMYSRCAAISMRPCKHVLYSTAVPRMHAPRARAANTTYRHTARQEPRAVERACVRCRAATTDTSGSNGYVTVRAACRRLCARLSSPPSASPFRHALRESRPLSRKSQEPRHQPHQYVVRAMTPHIHHPNPCHTECCLVASRLAG